MDDGSPRALKAVLIDLSGTLHIEDPAVPGAQEALSSVCDHRIRIFKIDAFTKRHFCPIKIF
uniref:Uncharacterized protein n=2 Tax=Cyprinus carpio TaxID=7962 RepID=A0A8C1BP62_CYPCA